MPVTVPEEVILNAPLPPLIALIPLVTPLTSATWMVKSVPLDDASIPVDVSPITAPVDVILSAPVPVLSATIPASPPVTFRVAMVKSVPAFVASIPLSAVPVTSPVDVILSAPVPVLTARMPFKPPVTLNESTRTNHLCISRIWNHTRTCGGHIQGAATSRFAFRAI